MDQKSNIAFNRSYYLEDRFLAEDGSLQGGDFVVPKRKTEKKKEVCVSVCVCVRIIMNGAETNEAGSENKGS